MVRNTLKDGLAFEQKLGVNPFRLGFVGSTDNHDGAAGSVAESGWGGGQGDNDSSPTRQIRDEARTNPGGLAVAWAEENSRDAIFSALRRRETYATSGTRPVVRFFAGDLAGVRCGAASFVRDAYASGTPMGGDLGLVSGARGPRFAVWAAKDPGTADAPGTDLQRIQIVKGWVDARGRTHEARVRGGGRPEERRRGEPRDLRAGRGGFSRAVRALARPDLPAAGAGVLLRPCAGEPDCRWSTRVCKAAGVDSMSEDCAEQAFLAGAAFANCCLGPDNDPFIDPLVQERAWTSPIWYRPRRSRGCARRCAMGRSRGRTNWRCGSCSGARRRTSTRSGTTSSCV